MSRKEKNIAETVSEAALVYFEYALHESTFTSKEKEEAAEAFEKEHEEVAADLSELCDCTPADLDNAANAARDSFEKALKNAVSDLKRHLAKANSTASKKDSKKSVKANSTASKKDSKKSTAKSDGGIKKKRPTSRRS